MKRKSTIVAASAGVLLLEGLCQTANANLLPAPQTYNATMTAISGAAIGDTFKLDSEYTVSGGVYTYYYEFTGADPAFNGINELSVNFSVLATAPNSVTGGTSSTMATDDVSWNFSPAATSSGTWALSFQSPDGPTLGSASAEDGGTWTGSGVVVPGVPDGGLTLSLLGGSLMGLQALRRKLAR